MPPEPTEETEETTTQSAAPPRPEPPEDLPLDLLVEAALFSAGRPLSVEEIREHTGIPDGEIKDGLRILKANYDGRHTSIDVVQSGTKWSMVLRPRFADRARHIVPAEIPKHTLHTLALIAYHQPVLQSSIKEMVGPRVYEHVGILVEAGLVRKKPEGLSFELSTTESFPEYFGIPSDDAEDIPQFLAAQVGVERKRREAQGIDIEDMPPDEVLILAALAALAEKNQAGATDDEVGADEDAAAGADAGADEGPAQAG